MAHINLVSLGAYFPMIFEKYFKHPVITQTRIFLM